MGKASGFGMANAVRIGLRSVFLAAIFLAGSAQGQSGKAVGTPPIEITPEAALALQSSGIAFRLVEAKKSVSAPPSAKDPRFIYFTTGPSFRAAQEAAMRDRAATPPRESQRLTGTPLDWSRLGLKIPGTATGKPESPSLISVKELSEALKDGADLQIIDLRPAVSGNAAAPSPLPSAIRLLPHQVEEEMTKLPKLRWLVLVDDGNRVAQPVADKLFSQGYLLICILDGGYPAWASAINR